MDTVCSSMFYDFASYLVDGDSRTSFHGVRKSTCGDFVETSQEARKDPLKLWSNFVKMTVPAILWARPKIPHCEVDPSSSSRLQKKYSSTIFEANHCKPESHTPFRRSRNRSRGGLTMECNQKRSFTQLKHKWTKLSDICDIILTSTICPIELVTPSFTCCCLSECSAVSAGILIRVSEVQSQPCPQTRLHVCSHLSGWTLAQLSY